MQVESNNGLRGRFMIPPCIDLSAVTVCSSETEKRWKSNQNGGSNFNKSLNMKVTNSENMEIRIGADQLPIDPRDWTRLDVKTWILNLGRDEGVDANHIADKFKMNGKALCLMSVEMFLSRFPTGGKMLYRDFRLRLTRAMSI